MKPAAFRYARPLTVQEALDVLAEEPGARVLAGGQSLITLLNLRLARPEVLVDLGAVQELRRTIEVSGQVILGAMVTYRELIQNPIVTRRHPVLKEMVSHIGHISIRNRGTLGGAVAQADPGGEFPAAMVLLGAQIWVDSRARGRRIIPAEEFFVGHYESVLDEDEMVTWIAIPDQENGRNWGFKEFALRHRDYPLAGAGVIVRVDSAGKLTHLRASLINAGETPVLLEEADRLPTTAEFPEWEAWARNVTAQLTPEADDADYARDLSAQALVIAGLQARFRALSDIKDTDEQAVDQY